MFLKVKNSHTRSVLRKGFYFIVAATITMVIGCPSCLTAPLHKSIYFIAFSFLMFFGLWQSNNLLSIYLDRRLSWIKNPIKRLVVSLAGTLAVSLVVVLVIHSIFLASRGKTLNNLNPNEILNLVTGPVLITLIISMAMHSRSFLLGWRQTAIDAEKLKGENISSQYETLKNQVNPHFLFNSLNTLTSLVHEQPDLAVKFIKQLSEVYRYVLDSQNKEVVPLATELKFVQSYVFLQQIRFGDDLQVCFDVPENSQQQIAPLSVQMLIENAVKHNIILEESPLNIRIYLEAGQYLVVANNLQEKKTGIESSELGLKNIKARYEYLTDRPVHILRDAATFTVKLPVLNFSKA